MNVSSETMIAVVGVVLGAPFLNFMLAWTRKKADKDSVIATGAGTTVTAMAEAIESLRKELIVVRKGMKDQQVEYDQQIAEVREEYEAKIREIEERHVREIEALTERYEHRIAQLERLFMESRDDDDDDDRGSDDEQGA